MSIRKGTTKIDYSTTNEEKGDEYRSQLYYHLREDYDGNNRVIPRNRNHDKIIIEAYEKAMKELGLDPNTEELLKEVSHDNLATNIRLTGGSGLSTLFYQAFKTVTDVIENKHFYLGEEVEEGIIRGISKTCICIENNKGDKEFFWYTAPPLRYNNANALGVEICEELIKKYGKF